MSCPSAQTDNHLTWPHGVFAPNRQLVDRGVALESSLSIYE